VTAPLRFAVVGAVNTLLDVTLFLLLRDDLGIVAANFVSTSAGMTSSFVVNGLFTFGAGRLTARHALLFVSTTGVILWVAQPLVMYAVLGVADVLWLAKVVAIGTCLVLNFAAYRFVVWPNDQGSGQGSATESVPAPRCPGCGGPAPVAAGRSPRPALGSSPRACPARSCAAAR
jgi:putative flippase GtrA